MASKVFLDANVLLDLTLKRDGYDVAKSIINRVIEGHIQAYITSSIITIVGHWLTKAYDHNKAKEIILSLLVDVQVIDSPSEIVLTAMHSKVSDIEDALQYYTAIHHKIDYFISGNIKLKKESIPILPVYTPKEFLEEL